MNRATNAPFTVWDNTSQVASASVNEELAAEVNRAEGGVNFQTIAASVTINSGTLMVKLSDAANEYVIADAVRIQAVASALDITPPTANLVSPASGAGDGVLVGGSGNDQLTDPSGRNILISGAGADSVSGGIA